MRTNTRRAPRRAAPKRRKGAIAGGKAEQLGWPVERYDQRQLAMGIEAELEHTSDPSIAREIAMDHLAEQVLEGKPQDYYTRLAKMEANPMSDEEWDALFERQQRDKASFMREAAGRFGQSGTVIVRGADWAFITLTRSTYPGVNYQVTRWDIEDGQVVPLGHVDVKGDLDAALQELWWFASKKDGVRFQEEMTDMTPSPMSRNAKTDLKELHFAGYDFTSGPGGTVIHREKVDTGSTEDYGADPLGDGTFRMVPSGDIVDFAERNRRLEARKRHMRRNTAQDYGRAMEIANEQLSLGNDAIGVLNELRKAGFKDEVFNQAIALYATEQRQKRLRMIERGPTVPSALGPGMSRVSQMDPFWRAHQEQEERSPRLRASSTVESSLSPIEVDAPRRRELEFSAEELREELKSQLAAGVINRDQYADGMREIRDGERAGKTTFLRNARFPGFRALQERLGQPILYMESQVDSGADPEQAADSASRRYGLSGNDAEIMRHIAGAQASERPVMRHRFEPTQPPMRGQEHHFSVNGKGTWAYTEEGRVFVPEKQFSKLPPGFHVVPLRGYAHTWAVMRDDDSCDGWILQEDLPGGGPGYDPNPRKTPSPSSGYAYKADESVHDRNFRQAKDDVWETVMITPERGFDWHYLGTRYIDDAKVNVWRVTEPMSGEKVYYAQTVALTGNGEESIPPIDDLDENSDPQTEAAIKAHESRFGRIFALYNYPGEIVRISRRSSYRGSSGPMLYVQRVYQGNWVDFVKGTPSELMRESSRGWMGDGMEPNPYQSQARTMLINGEDPASVVRHLQANGMDEDSALLAMEQAVSEIT